MSTKKRLFVVDDDPFITQLVVKKFSNEKYEVLPFTFGEDCLDALDQEPDLIILDYYFYKSGKEVMNGMEIFDRIKDARPDMPVIMLSGQDRGDLVLELARKGIDDYVIKDNTLIENLEVAIQDILPEE